MIVSIHQPAYLPWMGYFDKIKNSDIFVYLDMVQFERGSFINRNKIKGDLWLTVPIKKKGKFGQCIMDVEIDNTQKWRAKHLKTIYQTYCKEDGFHNKFVRLKNMYNKNHDKLTDFLIEQLRFFLEEFEIKVQVVKARDIKGKKSELVANICKELGATKYISGRLGKNYLDESLFNGIEIEYQEDCQFPLVLDYWFCNNT
jgi:hypothetical protein